MKGKMRKFWVLAFSFLFLTGAQDARAESECKVKEADIDGIRGWILENDSLKIEIFNPGAALKNIYLKKSGNGLLNDSHMPEPSMKDCFPVKDYKGDFSWGHGGLAPAANWKMKIVESSKDKIKVSFSSLFEYEPTWEKNSAFSVPYKGKDKISITRIDTLVRGKPIYKREYIIENLGEQDAAFWYNIHSTIAVGGSPENDRIIAPSRLTELLSEIGGSYYTLSSSQPYIASWDSITKETLIYLGPFDSCWPEGKLWFKYVHLWGVEGVDYNLEPSPTPGIDEDLEAFSKYAQVLKKGEKWNYIFYIIGLSNIESEKDVHNYIKKDFIDPEGK